MLITRLYLILLAAGAWRGGDDWRTDLRWLVWALIPDEHDNERTPSQAFDHLHALLAVAVTLLRQDARLDGGREEDLLATDAWREARDWIAEADSDLAEALLLPSTQPFARVATSADVRDTIDLAKAAANDPHAEARAELESAGHTVTSDHGLWIIEGTFGNPFLAAARAASTLGRESSQAAVLARNARRAVLLLWVDRTMLLADSRVPVWRLYTFAVAFNPLSRLTDQAGPPPGAQTTPLSAPPAEAEDLARALGFELAHALSCLRNMA
jgi:hypothetical protein